MKLIVDVDAHETTQFLLENTFKQWAAHLRIRDVDEPIFVELYGVPDQDEQEWDTVQPGEMPVLYRRMTDGGKPVGPIRCAHATEVVIL